MNDHYIIFSNGSTNLFTSLTSVMGILLVYLLK